MKQHIFIQTYSKQILQENLNNLASSSAIKSVLCFITEAEQFDLEELNHILQTFEKPILGGIFPEVVCESERKKTGILLIGLSFSIQTTLLRLDSGVADIQLELQFLLRDLEQEPSSLLLFVDAFSPFKHKALDEIYNFFGLTLSYLGGGAGSLRFEQRPCVLTNSGLVQNAFAIGITTKKLFPGVAHGWKPISEPIKVTKAKNSIVASLNWNPAFDYYKTIVEQHSGLRFTDSNFFDIAKSYPVGISKLQSEFIVRDPIQLVDEQSIKFVDEIQEGEFVHILYGKKEWLLEGAKEARKKALKKWPKLADVSGLFLIDCISRVLYMKDDFQLEMNVLATDNRLNGILSIGEIANCGEYYLQMYNKTIALTAL